MTRLRLVTRVMRRLKRTLVSTVLKSLDVAYSIPGVLDPLRLVSLSSRAVPPALFACVYRYKNAAVVERLVAQCAHSNIQTKLWALDKTHPDLASVTVGEGPGFRFALLNRLLENAPADNWLVISDDDVRFGQRGIATLLRTCDRFGFGLAQPAHARVRSHYSYRMTLRKSWRLARETTFVEIGPVVVIAPSAREGMVPFPEEGMGWGVELLWYDRHLAGLRIGVIDVSPVRHLSPGGRDYDWSSENERLLRLLAERNLESMRDVQHTIRSVRWPGGTKEV